MAGVGVGVTVAGGVAGVAKIGVGGVVETTTARVSGVKIGFDVDVVVWNAAFVGG